MRQVKSKQYILTMTNRDVINPRLLESDELSEEESPDLEAESFQVFIGKRPIIRDFREIAEKAEKAFPEKLQGLEKNKILLVETTVGVWQQKGLRKPTQLGFEISYPKKPFVTVRDILPQSRYVKLLGGTLSCDAGIAVNGAFCEASTDLVGSVLEHLIPDVSLPNVSSVSGLDLKLGGKAEVFGNFSFQVGTKTIDAIGINDDHCKWMLTKDGEPLTGKAHHFVHIVLVPKLLSELRFKCRVTIVTSLLHTFERPFRSDWKWIKAREIP
jgi:hypothetical protein